MSGLDLKDREKRQAVLIPARMRWDGDWQSGKVRNISSQGLMMNMPDPPEPGTYVEVQIGALTHVARAVWTSGLAVGLRSREAIDLESLHGNSGPAPARTLSRQRASLAAQTYQPTVRQRHEESRWLASLFQYATFVAVALSAASFVAWEVHQTLSASTSAIGSALKPNINQR